VFLDPEDTRDAHDVGSLWGFRDLVFGSCTFAAPADGSARFMKGKM
jgi:hypothetical protein